MSRAAIQSDEYGSLFRKVSASKHRVLMVDYDGTLAPFSCDRHRAVPYPEIPRLLCRVMDSCGTRLIVLSGRAAEEVVFLLGLSPPPEIWGTHGMEKRRLDGHYEEGRVDDGALQVLVQAETELESAELGPHIEVKLAGVAVHWRGLTPSKILKIRTKAYRILEPLARQPDLTLAEFEEGVEIRLLSANKGNAVRTLLDELPSDVPVAYLGDDSTDEDAFRVLDGRGLSILVRPHYRLTAAKTWLKPPDGLIRFLTDWIRACRAACDSRRAVR